MNKKAVSAVAVLVVSLLVVLLIVGIIFFKGVETLNKSAVYFTRLERQSALEGCENLDQNFMFNNLAERIHDPIYNRDGDDYLDSCDLCVGYEDNNGYNMELDNDNDLIHGDCDKDDDHEDNKMMCKNYLKAYSTEEDELLSTGRCGTEAYCDFLVGNDHKSGWGEQELYCEDEP